MRYDFFTLKARFWYEIPKAKESKEPSSKEIDNLLSYLKTYQRLLYEFGFIVYHL